MPPLSILAALLLQAIAAPSFTSGGINWELLPTAPIVRTELDPASISRAGNRVTVTVRSEQLEQAREKRIAVMILDCAEHSFGIRTMHHYAPDGTHVRTQDWPDVTLLRMSGGGLDELRARVCPRE
jgi:hypothetical protein